MRAGGAGAKFHFIKQARWGKVQVGYEWPTLAQSPDAGNGSPGYIGRRMGRAKRYPSLASRI